MKAAAQAYRPRWQTHAYGIGARNHFRSPTHVFLREPELLRMNDNNQSDDVIHLRYQHHARTPRASVSQDPSHLRRYPDQISAARPQVLTSLGKASDMVRASNRTEWHLPTFAGWEATMAKESPHPVPILHHVAHKLRTTTSVEDKEDTWTISYRTEFEPVSLGPSIDLTRNASGATLFKPLLPSRSTDKTTTSPTSDKSEYTPSPHMHAPPHGSSCTHARETTTCLTKFWSNKSVTRTHTRTHKAPADQDSCLQPSPTPTKVVGTTLRGMGPPETSNDFVASALAREWYDYDKCTGTHAHTHTLHDTRLRTETLVKADDAADQVGCRDPHQWVIDSSCYLNTALEAAQLNAAAVSGDATGHPGVVSSLGLGTHPDAVSDWIWSQAPVTPRPRGDDLPPWFCNHEIYHAPTSISTSKVN